MKRYILIFLLLNVLVTYGQGVKNLYPSNIYTLDFSQDLIENFNTEESFNKCMQVWKTWDTEGRSYQEATPEELEILKYCDEVREDVWDIVGGGCSWYCGGGPIGITASSYLSTQGENTYEPKNAHDLSYQSAWVEGVKGYGAGEYLLYTFAATSPRINKVIIVNGYVKSKSAWKDNSRVKSIKMYVDNAPYAILHLEDKRAEQTFKVDPISNGNRADFEKLKSMPDWTVKFEILDVYQGDKYDDVVITEIYFDGLDVHCLAKGTLITMADSTFKKIEDLKIGDKVTSINQETGQYESSTILELARPIHNNLIKIQFSNGDSIVCTKDHPLLSEDGNWLSYHPVKTQHDYLMDHVEQLMIGSVVKSMSGKIKITKIQELDGERETYTIVRLDKNNSFISNGIIVGTETLRKITSTDAGHLLPVPHP